MTVNPVSKLNCYPIPRTEDIFATHKQGKNFTKLDLSQVYLQLKLEEESSKYVVINTIRATSTTRVKYFLYPLDISESYGTVAKGYSTRHRVYQ